MNYYKGMNYFLVWHENGGYIAVPAKDAEHAKEVFYQCLENMLGKKDRKKFVRITEVTRNEMSEIYCTHDNVKLNRICIDCGAFL